MNPWGINQKSTRDALDPLAQADPPSSSRSESATAKHRRASVALVLAGSLLLVAGGTLHSLRKSAFLNLPGTTRLAGKSQPAKSPASLLKGTSLFGDFSGNSPNKLEPDKATRMSGVPLSLPLFFEANRGQTDARVKFLARSGGYTLFVTPTETIFAGARNSASHG